MVRRCRWRLSEVVVAVVVVSAPRAETEMVADSPDGGWDFLSDETIVSDGSRWTDR